MKKRKTRVNRRSLSSMKRRQTRAIQPNLRNGTSCRGLLGSLAQIFSPVLKALGMR